MMMHMTELLKESYFDSGISLANRRFLFVSNQLYSRIKNQFQSAAKTQLMSSIRNSSCEKGEKWWVQPFMLRVPFHLTNMQITQKLHRISRKTWTKFVIPLKHNNFPSNIFEILPSILKYSQTCQMVRMPWACLGRWWREHAPLLAPYPRPSIAAAGIMRRSGRLVSVHDSHDVFLLNRMSRHLP